MSTYTAHVIRDGRWWMIHIPTLDNYDGGRFPGEALTQARRFEEVQREAIDYIVSVTNCAPGDVELAIVVDGDLGALYTEAAAAIELKRRAAVMERDAIDRSARVAHALALDGVPVRDIGAMLGVTYQRAAQLAGST